MTADPTTTDLLGDRRAVLRDVTAAGPAAVLDRRLEDAELAMVLAGLVDTEMIDQALARAGHADLRKRSLPGPAVMAAVLGGALYSGEGYDSVLAKTAPYLRGGTLLPGAVPTGSALSGARARLGPSPMCELFTVHADAAAASEPDAFGLVVTAFDGTCLELARDDWTEPVLAETFGCPAGSKRAQARMVALVVCRTRRIIAAAIDGYHVGEQTLVDQIEHALVPGTLNLADRNFFSMDRWLRFAATGAHLAWRVKNGNGFTGTIIEQLPDGSALVRLRESDGMRTRRRKKTGDPRAERLPDTVARLVEFTVTVAAAGKARTSRIRLLTTLLDHDAFPAVDLARCYAERWQVEITFLRLKSTLRGDGTVLRGRSPELVHQEIWAYLIIYNALCDLAVQAAALDGIDPDDISFVNVLRHARQAVAAGRPCGNCGHRPEQQRETLIVAIVAGPRNRSRRQRTSPRTAKERQTGHGSKAIYTIDIVTSNPPETD